MNGPVSVEVGETFSVTVEAQGVTEPGLYGVQLEVNYDPGLVTAANPQVNPDLSFVVLNDVDNVLGKIRLAASRQGNVPGLPGDVTLLTFEVTAADSSGDATFTFENEKIGDPEANPLDVITQSYTVSIEAIATPEPTQEPTAEPTEEPTAEPTEEPTTKPTEEPTAEPTEEPTPEPTEEPTPEPIEVIVSGQVTLAGRAGDDWSDATVTVDDSGQDATTDVAGNFSIVAVATGPHTSISADAAGYLSALCITPTVTTPETVLNVISLLSGDISGDDLVDITDATAVGASFGATGPGLPADINRDEIVDIFDIILVSVNFGIAGPQAWTCQ
jgi:outer membrane biosynthesis protein TonB